MKCGRRWASHTLHKHVKRTTILIDEALLAVLRHLARQQGGTLTDVVRQALEEYVRAHRVRRKISFVGIGSNGRADVSERIEELLEEAAPCRKGLR